jgi:hypothetical protein
MVAITTPSPKRRRLESSTHTISEPESGAVIMDRSRHTVPVLQIVAAVGALLVLFVIVASFKPFDLGRDLSSETKMLIVLATLACGLAVGVVGVSGLWKK